MKNPVGCTCVTWLKENTSSTSQESLQQEKPHHCNSHFHFPSKSAATNTTAPLGRGIYAPQAHSFPQHITTAGIRMLHSLLRKAGYSPHLSTRG